VNAFLTRRELNDELAIVAVLRGTPLEPKEVDDFRYELRGFRAADLRRAIELFLPNADGHGSQTPFPGLLLRYAMFARQEREAADANRDDDRDVEDVCS
jgi:hypothetical protein